MAILTAVVSENMLGTSARFAEEEKQRNLDISHRKAEEKLLEIFQAWDPSQSGRMSRMRWREMLNDEVGLVLDLLRTIIGSTLSVP